MQRPCHLCLLLFLCLLLLLLAPAHSSPGDRDPAFQSCVAACTAECSLPPPLLPVNDSSPAPLPSPHVRDDGRLYAATNHHPSFSLRLFRWSCADLCKYDCMRLHAELRRERGAVEWKYYGKWPFVRVLGMQELLSVVFSIGNLLPHALYFVLYRRRVSRRYNMRNLWSAYALISCNTWLWSAVFHARDVLLTERLDYFCASLGIVLSFSLQLIRFLHISSPLHRSLLLLLALCLLSLHCGYLQFVHFDYGYNMRASLALGVAYSVFTSAAFLRERRPYGRTVLLSHLFLWCAAVFEVLDFPPLLGLLDAHALWHALTMPLGVVFWQVQIEDAKWELELQDKRRRAVQTPSQAAQEQRLLLVDAATPNGKTE